MYLYNEEKSMAVAANQLSQVRSARWIVIIYIYIYI